MGTDVYFVEVPVARLGQPMSGTSWVAAKKWGKEYQTFWETLDKPLSSKNVSPSTSELDYPLD